MSRDFIGSLEGRSFLQSPNRDRVTRGVQEFPYFASVRFLSTRWGGFDWCLGGHNAPTQFLVSANRYRRIRIRHTWPTQLAFPAGVREDLIEYGDGLTDPVASNIQEDDPLTQYPDVNVSTVSATATERRDLVSSSNPSVLAIDRVITLEDPVSVDPFIAESYVDFDGMTNFQHRIRLFQPPAFNEYDDRAYWSRGPLKWGTQPDILLPGTTRVTSNLATPSIGTQGGASNSLEHHPSGSKQFIELGTGSRVFIVPEPPGNGAVARIAALAGAAVASVTNPGHAAGAPVIDGIEVLLSFVWLMDLTKVNMQASQGQVQRYGRQLGVPVVPFTQFDLSSQTLPGGILEPPTAAQVTFYGVNAGTHYYSRILIPPYTQAS